MPRFVVLEHDSPRGRHWDLMFETGAALATWALDEPPDAASEVQAQSLTRHRIAYLDYEGPVSGDRGSVARWDEGTFRFEHRDATRVETRLLGKKLRGHATLSRTPETPDRWRFAFAPHEPD